MGESAFYEKGEAPQKLREGIARSSRASGEGEAVAAEHNAEIRGVKFFGVGTARDVFLGHGLLFARDMHPRHPSMMPIGEQPGTCPVRADPSNGTVLRHVSRNPGGAFATDDDDLAACVLAIRTPRSDDPRRGAACGLVRRGLRPLARHDSEPTLTNGAASVKEDQCAAPIPS